MTFTYDPTTDLGFVRLLIPDTIEGNATYDNEEIGAFLDRNGGDVYLAAAAAVDNIAANEVLVMKVMTIQGVTTNGASEAKALQDYAKTLRARSGIASGIGDVTADELSGGEYIGVGSAAVDEFSWRELRNV